jgi:hypothetical protein
MKVFNLLIFIASCSSTIKEDKNLPLNRKLRQCYVESDSYQGRFDKAQGKLMIALSADQNGKVTTVNVISSDYKDPNLISCVREVFKSTPLEHSAQNEYHEVRKVKFKPVRR